MILDCILSQSNRSEILKHGPMARADIQFQDFLALPKLQLLVRDESYTPKERKPFRENYSHEMYELLSCYAGYIVMYEVLAAAIFGDLQDRASVETSVRSLRRAEYFSMTENVTFKDLGIGLGVRIMPLEPIAYKTLQYFWSRIGEPISREELHYYVWGENSIISDTEGSKMRKTLFVVRKHLETTKFQIRTIYVQNNLFRYCLDTKEE